MPYAGIEISTFQRDLDSLRGSSDNIGKIQKIWAWPLRKDDTHKPWSVNICWCLHYHASLQSSTSSTTCGFPTPVFPSRRFIQTSENKLMIDFVNFDGGKNPQVVYAKFGMKPTQKSIKWFHLKEIIQNQLFWNTFVIRATIQRFYKQSLKWNHFKH